MTLILVALSFILFFYRLGDYSFWDSDEPLYTEIAREMIITGDWLTPHWNYRPWFCHPPLYMWLTAGISFLTGWNEFTGRFFAAVFAVGIVVVTYFLGKSLFSQRAGLLAGFVCATSFQMLIHSHIATLDTIFVFFMSLALLFFYLGFSRGGGAYFFGFWMASALATLAKGPLGLCLPLGVGFLFLLFQHKPQRIFELRFQYGLPLFLLIAAPWYAAECYLYGRNFYKNVFVFFIFKRIFTPILQQSGPWYYYFAVLIPGFFPWTIFLPQALERVFRERTCTAQLFLIMWLVPAFLFFSLAATKLPNYILILYPGLSVAVGTYWDRYLAKDHSIGSGGIRPSLVALFFLTLLVSIAFVLFASGKFPEQYAQAKHTLAPLGLLPVSGALLSLILIPFRRDAFIPVSLCAAFLFNIYAVHVAITADGFKVMKPIAFKVRDAYRDGEELGVTPSVSGSNSFIFYTGKRVHYCRTDEEKKDFLRSSKRYYYLAYREELPDLEEMAGRRLFVLEAKGRHVLLSNRKRSLSPHKGKDMQEHQGRQADPVSSRHSPTGQLPVWGDSPLAGSRL